MGARRLSIPLIVLFVLLIAIIAGLVLWSPGLRPINGHPENTPTASLPASPTPTQAHTRLLQSPTRAIICPARLTHTPPQITLSTYPEVPTLSDPEWPGFDVFIEAKAGTVVRTLYARENGACVVQREEEEPDVLSRVLLQVFPVGEDIPIVKELLLNIQPPYGMEVWDGGYHVVPEKAGSFEVKVRARTAKGQVAEAETTVVVYEDVIQMTPTPTSEAQTP